MNTPSDLLHLAEAYHADLPPRIRSYLNSRGIPDAVIDRHLLGWNGSRITIPIANRQGEVAFFKLAKDPEDGSDSPKMLAPRGMRYELYGWERLRSRPERLIVCEGEFDRLVLEAQGFPAATSTGGAGTFRHEWTGEFVAIPKVYLCFDRDEAGWRGTQRIGRLIPHAKVVVLPEEVGEGGDVTDFFVRLGRSGEDFEKLLAAAKPVPPSSEPERAPIRTWHAGDPSRER
ncbi:MAG: toprim domain-containing protein, partial [Vicinamibacteria bacterium]